MSTDRALLSASPLPMEPVQLPRLERDYNLLDLWKVMRRRWQWIAGAVALALLLGVLYNLFTPKLYKAQGQLQLLNRDASAVLSDPSAAASSAAADALDFNLAVQTDVDVLRSRNMALRVMQELGLDRDKDYLIGNDAAEKSRPLEQSPKRMAYALERFDKRLGVESVAGTRLLSVTFLDRDPQKAATVVNKLLADFIDYNFQLRFAASSQATGYLRGQLEAMKAQVDASQANVVRLQQESGIYGVDETNNAVNAKLEQLNAQLTTAEANRAAKESVYRLAITRDPEVLAGMIGAQGTGANTTNAPLQMLRQQQAEASATYAELNAHYGPQYPKVIQAGQRLQAIQTSINKETERLVGQATAEYKVAADTQNSAARALAAQKTAASKMNHDALMYTSAKHDADTNRDLYEKLQQRLKEAGVLTSLRSTNLNILDTAVAPSKSAKPVLLSLLAALLAGLLAGLVAAFGSEALDSAVRDPQKIEETLGVPVLGLIPPVETVLPRVAVQALRKSVLSPRWQYQTTARAPRSRVAEAFRVLRTSILFSLRRKPAKVLAVTSTSEGEGKSFTTFNLGSAFAQSGRSVLVVDADLRKRTLTEALEMQDHEGLDQALAEADWHKSVVSYPEMPGLFVMPAGRVTDYHGDMLGSVSMSALAGTLRENFDIILMDTPSMLAVSDTLSLTSAVDAVLVVAQCGITAEHSLARTLDMLRRAGARVLGVVMNGIDFRSPDFYYYWGKTGNGYNATPAQILSPVAPRPSAAKVITGTLTVLLGAITLCFAGVARAQGSPAAVPIHLDGSQAAQTSAPVPSGASTSGASAMPATEVNAEAAAQKTIIGVGDLLAVSVFDAPELTQDVRVSADGSVHLTILGDLHAAGMQPNALAGEMEKQFRDRNLIRTPQVSVTIKEFTTQGVTIEGEVKKPGLYPIYAERSLIDVVAMADGLTPNADTHVSIKRHGSNMVQRVQMDQSDPDLSQRSVRVYPGDLVIVPRAGLAYVLGNVGRPGGYLMHDNGQMTVLQAISEAQGTTRAAAMNRVVLLHKSDGRIIREEVPLNDMLKGKKADIALANGDILFVPSSGLKTFGYNTEGIMASVSGAALYSVAR